MFYVFVHIKLKKYLEKFGENGNFVLDKCGNHSQISV